MVLLGELPHGRSEKKTVPFDRTRIHPWEFVGLFNSLWFKPKVKMSGRHLRKVLKVDSTALSKPVREVTKRLWMKLHSSAECLQNTSYSNTRNIHKYFHSLRVT